MNGRKHLPMFGVGPVYGTVIIAVTAAAVVFGHTRGLDFLRILMQR